MVKLVDTADLKGWRGAKNPLFMAASAGCKNGVLLAVDGLLVVLVCHWLDALLNVLVQLFDAGFSHHAKASADKRYAQLFFELGSVIQLTSRPFGKGQIPVMGTEAVPFPVIQPKAHLPCVAVGAFEQHHAAIPQVMEFMFGFGLQQVQMGKAAGWASHAGWADAGLL
jgi:hypothetical protein